MLKVLFANFLIRVCSYSENKTSQNNCELNDEVTNAFKQTQKKKAIHNIIDIITHRFTHIINNKKRHKAETYSDFKETFSFSMELAS